MPLLYDFQAGHVVDVPDEQVGNAVASGRFGFRQGVEIPVVSPDGERGSLSSAEAAKAFQEGFKYYTRAEQKADLDEKIGNIRKEAFDSPLVAGTAGALRGLTFGLSDQAMGAIGGDDMREGLSSLKKYNPIASTTGEIGGTALGLLSGAGALGAGVKGAAALGGMASARVAGSLGSGITARIAAGAAGSAVEGALYGTGQVISEQALGELKNLTAAQTAQHVIASVGLGGLIGGGVGGLTTTGLEGAKALREYLASQGTSLADKVGAKASKLIANLKGLSPEQEAKVTEALVTERPRVLRYMNEPEQLKQDALSAVAKVKDLGADVQKLAMETRNAAKDILDVPISKRLENQQDYLIEELNNTLQVFESKPSYYSQGTKASLEQIRDDLEEAFLSMPATKMQQHEIVENARKQIDKYVDFDKNLSRGVAQDTQKEMLALRGKFKEHLEQSGPDLYGKFGDDYKLLNEGFHQADEIKKKFNKFFATKDTDGSIILDEGKVSNYFNRPNATANINKQLWLKNYQKKLLALVGRAEETGAAPEVINSLRNQLQSTKSTIDSLEKMRDLVLAVNATESYTGKSLHGTIIGGLAGSALGGPIGTLVGSVAGGAIINPRTTLKILGRLERLGDESGWRILDTVKNFASSSGTEAAVKLSHEPPSYGKILKGLGGSATVGSVDDLRSRTSQLMSSPQAVEQALLANNPMLDIAAPQAFAQMTATLQRAAQFINSKIPMQGEIDPFGQRPQTLSKAQESKLFAYASAALSPDKIMQEMKSGAVRPETVEAVQTVYPDLYHEIRSQVSVAVLDKKMPYQKRLQLSKLFQVPGVSAFSNELLQDGTIVKSATPQARSGKSFKGGAVLSGNLM